MAGVVTQGDTALGMHACQGPGWGVCVAVLQRPQLRPCVRSSTWVMLPSTALPACTLCTLKTLVHSFHPLLAPLQAYIENFLHEQGEAKATARAAAQAEEQKIQDYWSMVAAREAGEAARKAARKDAADRIYDQLRLDQEAALRAKVNTCPPGIGAGRATPPSVASKFNLWKKTAPSNCWLLHNCALCW